MTESPRSRASARRSRSDRRAPAFDDSGLLPAFPSPGAVGAGLDPAPSGSDIGRVTHTEGGGRKGRPYNDPGEPNASR